MWHFITDFGDTAITVPLALLMAAFLLASKEQRLALGWVGAIVICAGAIGALKVGLAACGQPLHSAGLSSPSGHTAMSIAVYGGFAAVIGAPLARPARLLLNAGAAVFAVAIALSRAMLDVHSPVEVGVGLAVGTLTLAIIHWIVVRHQPQRLPLAWLATGAFAVAVLLHGDRWPAEQAVHRLALWLDLVRPWCS